MEGKASNGSEWRGCPPEYVFVEAVFDEEEELELLLEDELELLLDDEEELELLNNETHL